MLLAIGVEVELIANALMCNVHGVIGEIEQTRPPPLPPAPAGALRLLQLQLQLR